MSHVSTRPRPRHVLFAFVSTIVAVLAVSVSPASANRTFTSALVQPPLSKFCGQTQPAFAPLSRLTARTASVARGSGSDVAREPGSADAADEVPATARGKSGKSFRATVDVYFHVVYDPAIPASKNPTLETTSKKLGRPNISRWSAKSWYASGCAMAGSNRAASRQNTVKAAMMTCRIRSLTAM